jgi:hypothetical protein
MIASVVYVSEGDVNPKNRSMPARCLRHDGRRPPGNAAKFVEQERASRKTAADGERAHLALVIDRTVDPGTQRGEPCPLGCTQSRVNKSGMS